MFAPSIIMRAIKSAQKAGWFSILTATGTDYYTDIKTDAAGNAYVSGVIADAAYLAGGGTASDATLSKFDASGTPIWQMVFGGALADRADSLAVSTDGSVYVTSITNNAAVANDCYLAKFSSAGALLWAKAIGGTTAGSNDVAGSVAVCTDGNIVVTATLANPAGVSLLKFTPEGSVVWKRHFATASASNAGVLAASTGDIYIATTAISTVAYQTIAKYNASGVLQWQTRFTKPNSTGLRVAMAEGPDGGIYVASNCSGSLGTLKIDTTGALLWQTKTSALQNVYIGCATDASGNVFTSGYVSATQYVIKQDSNGIRLWQRTVGSGYETAAACLPNGDLLLAGFHSNTDSIAMRYPANAPVGTYGGRVFADPTTVTITTGTQVQSASTLVESASSAVVQDVTWWAAAARTIPVTRTTF